MRSSRPRLILPERALLSAMVLLAIAQGLSCAAAPTDLVRLLSLVGGIGAFLFALSIAVAV